MIYRTRIQDKKWRINGTSGERTNDDITAVPAGVKNTAAWAADDAPVIPAITTNAAIAVTAIALLITSCYSRSA